MQIDIDWTAIIGSACVAAAAAWMAWTAYRNRSGVTPAPVGERQVRSSDQKPPSGFVEHVACVQSAAPTAEPAVVLSYLSAGLTEAETLRAEVARMGSPKL